MPQRILFISAVLLLLTTSLTGCIKTFRIDIQQGNLISPNAADQIHKGMSSQAVTKQLGTPVLDSIFNDQLIYVYTFQPGHGAITKKQLVVTFQHNKVVQIEKKP